MEILGLWTSDMLAKSETFLAISRGHARGYEHKNVESANQDRDVAEILRRAREPQFIRGRPVILGSAGQMKVQDEELENLLAVLAQKYGTTVATLRAEARTKYCATFADKYALPWSLARRLTQYVCA